MNPNFMTKRALFVTCLLMVPALAGCHTVSGFGQDVQQAGRWISGGAETTQGWIFGSDAQAAEAQDSGTSGSGSGQDATPTSLVPEARDRVVYFASGSADIPPDGMDELRQIAAASAADFTTDAGQSAEADATGDGAVQSADSGTAQGSDADAMQTADEGSMQEGNMQNASRTARMNAGGTDGQGSDGAAMQTADNSGQDAGNGSGQNSGSGTGQNAPRIRVIGYADTAGPAELNRRLSQERAQAVADALAAQGVPRDAIDVEWHGEDQLPVPTADGVAEPQNRRVRIVMTGA
jgi:outer membrane protein OmpA-like peptidoglycan-associated protein